MNENADESERQNDIDVLAERLWTLANVVRGKKPIKQWIYEISSPWGSRYIVDTLTINTDMGGLLHFHEDPFIEGFEGYDTPMQHTTWNEITSQCACRGVAEIFYREKGLLHKVNELISQLSTK